MNCYLQSLCQIQTKLKPHTRFSVLYWNSFNSWFPCCFSISANHLRSDLPSCLALCHLWPSWFVSVFLCVWLIISISNFLHTRNIIFFYFYSEFNPFIMPVLPLSFLRFMQRFESKNYINENNFRSLHNQFPYKKLYLVLETVFNHRIIL